jgi:hypothetical protein
VNLFFSSGLQAEDTIPDNTLVSVIKWRVEGICLLPGLILRNLYFMLDCKLLAKSLTSISHSTG